MDKPEESSGGCDGTAIVTTGAKVDLADALDRERQRLARAAHRGGVIEDVMRIRALAEIAAVLSTAELLQLAVQVDAKAENRRPGDEPSAHQAV